MEARDHLPELVTLMVEHDLAGQGIDLDAARQMAPTDSLRRLSDERRPIFDIAGQRVWVVGHTGMVGSAVVRRLKAEDVGELITARSSSVDLSRQADVVAQLHSIRMWSHEPAVISRAKPRCSASSQRRPSISSISGTKT